MEGLLALMSFAFVMSITPGPNNILLMSSGLRFGVRRTLPHMAGIQLGLASQLILCAYGLGSLIVNNPAIITALRYLGTGYLIYLAWQLRSIRFHGPVENAGKPFTFLQAALFQFINPKAWIMAVTAGTLLLPEFATQWLSVVVLCLTFSAVGAPSSGSWAFFGALMQKFLQNTTLLRIFTFVLIGLTLYTALSLWM